MKSYRYLLIDADGTFLDFNSTEKTAIKLLFSRFDIPYTEKNLHSYHNANSQCWKDFESGLITMETLKTRRFSLFFESEGIMADPREAGLEYIRLLGEHPFWMPGAPAFLSRLREKHSLAVITNGIAHVQRERLERLDAMKYFDYVIISEEAGCQKPSKEFFDYTLRTIGAAKDECLIIGDSLSSDIKGGIDSGIDTCYLHIGKERSDNGKITFQAADYSQILSVVDADQLDIENQ